MLGSRDLGFRVRSWFRLGVVFLGSSVQELQSRHVSLALAALEVRGSDVRLLRWILALPCSDMFPPISLRTNAAAASESPYTSTFQPKVLRRLDETWGDANPSPRRKSES